MERRIVSGIMLALLLIGMSTLGFIIQPVKAEPRTWTVDDDEPADFSSIQQAINSPDVKGGDTIFVRRGTYYEHVVVNKSIFLIGENRSNTIIDGNGTMTVLCVKFVSNVEIMDFTIQNGGDFPYSGIFVGNCSGTTISNNIIGGGAYGIELLESNGSGVIGNTIMHSFWGGIYVHDSNQNVIRDNTVANNPLGAWIASSDAYFNVFYHNNFINNVNQVSDFGRGTIWDDGYPSGGNYWSDYAGLDLYSGPYQNETGGDKIGDIPYIRDRYPLMYPYGCVHSPDVNGDGIVDIIDIVIAALAFGSIQGDPNWNPYVDLNQDGIIDIVDLVMVTLHFGETW